MGDQRHNLQPDNFALGRCDFKQYEHCGQHERIPDVGQRFPPFGCKNWKPDIVEGSRESLNEAGGTWDDDYGLDALNKVSA